MATRIICNPSLSYPADTGGASIAEAVCRGEGRLRGARSCNRANMKDAGLVITASCAAPTIMAPTARPMEFTSTGPHLRIDNARLTAHIRAMPATAKSKSATKPKAKPAAANPAARPLKKGDHLFLVDGSGYIFRAYHALPPLTRKSDGLQVNAVLGFCNM